MCGKAAMADERQHHILENQRCSKALMGATRFFRGGQEDIYQWDTGGTLAMRKQVYWGISKDRLFYSKPLRRFFFAGCRV